MKKLNIKFWAMSLLLTATLASSVMADTEIAADQFISGRLRVGPDSNDANEPNWAGSTSQVNGGGSWSVALGYGAKSTGDYSYAIGRGAVAEGYGAVSIGAISLVTGSGSATESTTTARNSYAMGLSTSVLNADYAYAIGNDVTINANADYSLGMGKSSVIGAGSTHAIAIGYSSEVSASTQGATALGYDNTASGIYSMALGYKSSTTGDYSTTIGPTVTTQAFASVVMGRFNQVISSNASSWVATDPLLVLGNGTSSGATSNALVVLKNGNTGIGTNAPSSKLEVNGEVKVTTGDLKVATGKVLIQPGGDLSMGSFTAGPQP